MNPSSYMSVVMKSDTKALDEVVVTGMFNRKKEGFDGSAVTIKGEELKKYSTNNVAKAIVLSLPGFVSWIISIWGLIRIICLICVCVAVQNGFECTGYGRFKFCQ